MFTEDDPAVAVAEVEDNCDDEEKDDDGDEFDDDEVKSVDEVSDDAWGNPEEGESDEWIDEVDSIDEDENVFVDAVTESKAKSPVKRIKRGLKLEQILSTWKFWQKVLSTVFLNSISYL